MIGSHTLEELRQRMSADEYNGWIRYAHKVGGISPYRRIERTIQIELGKLRHLITCVNTPKGKPAPQIEDFMPKPDFESEPIEGGFKEVAAMFGATGKARIESGARWQIKKRQE